jgi:hypothetical protein
MKLADSKDNFFVPKVLAYYVMPWHVGGDSIDAGPMGQSHIFRLDDLNNDEWIKKYRPERTLNFTGSEALDVPDECANWVCLMAPECPACQNAKEVQQKIKDLYL